MARILIADDDDAIPEMISAFLAIDGHDIDVVTDGKAGYEKLSSNSYQLAILDWDMPHMSGLEACKQHRSDGGQTPILLLTAHDHEDDKERGLDAGADDYLTKPFSLKELAARVRSLLRRSQGNVAPKSSGLPFGIRMCTACNAQYDGKNPKNEVCAVDGAVTIVVTADRLVGRLVQDKFKIESLIGVGAWSEVFKATDTKQNIPVAMKVLHTHLAADPLKVARFNREADVLLQLQHPNLAKVYAQEKLYDGRPYLAMEFLQGMVLDRFVEANGRLTLEQTKEIFLPVADALAHAHDQGLIHRDLKPSNVFLHNVDGKIVPKVLDYGLVKMSSPTGAAMVSLTRTGEVLGTPAYMSPEQCLGRQLDTKTDLYALGCLIYEALTGQRAIPGKTAFEAMSNQISRFPDPFYVACPDVQLSTAVEDIVFKLLAKEPGERFSDARAFIAEFQAVQ